MQLSLPKRVIAALVRLLEKAMDEIEQEWFTSEREYFEIKQGIAELKQALKRAI